MRSTLSHVCEPAQPVADADGSRRIAPAQYLCIGAADEADADTDRVSSIWLAMAQPGGRPYELTLSIRRIAVLCLPPRHPKTEIHKSGGRTSVRAAAGGVREDRDLVTRVRPGTSV